MAGKPFKMEFVADVSKFIRGTKDVEDSLGKVSDSLDDLAREAQRSADGTAKAYDGVGDKIAGDVDAGTRDAADSLDTLGGDAKTAATDTEAAFKDTGRSISDALDEGARDANDSLADVADEAEDTAKDVDTAAEKMERSFKDAFDDVAKRADDAGKRVGKSSKDGFDKASQGADEFKDSAKQSAEEAASSFDGSLEGIADSAQEILSEAFSGFGPAGAAGGLAAAMGLGLAMSKLQEAADKVNELEEEAGSFALEFRDAGGNLEELDLVGKFDEWLVAIEDTKAAFEFWQADAITNLDNVRVAIDDTGISLADLYEAFKAGDTSTLEDYVAKLKEVNEQLVPEGHQANTKAINDEYQARKEAIIGLEDEIEKRKIAEETALDLRAADEGVTVQLLEQRDAIDQANDALREKAELNGEAETSELDYLDAVDATTDAIKKNGDTVDKNTEAGRNNRRALNDLRDKIVQYADTTEDATGSVVEANKVIADGRDEFIKQAQAAGMSREAAEKYADKLGLIPKDVTTYIQANGLDHALSRANEFDRTLNRINGKTVTAAVAMKQLGQGAVATGGYIDGKARGGVIPGQPSSTDNAGLYNLATGEYVVNADATAKNRELLDAINQGRKPAPTPGTDTKPATVNYNLTINSRDRVNARELYQAVRRLELNDLYLG